jgi:hypothetical protein
MTVTGKTEVPGQKPVPVSTTDPTLTDLGSNQDLRGERPATNRLSHDRASLACTVDTATHNSSINTPPPGSRTISYR